MVILSEHLFSIYFIPSITLLIFICLFFNIVAYHSRGGYISITQSQTTPLPDIFTKAASEIGLDVLDVNGKAMLGKIINKNILENRRDTGNTSNKLTGYSQTEGTRVTHQTN
jgi:hypothetical protein